MISPPPTGSLFDDPPEETIDDLVLLFPTNQMNLQEILSTGLLKPLEGYPENKYYLDVLKHCPGWLPLFVDRAPQEALSLAVEEQDFLTGVVLKIDGSKLTGGPVDILTPGGNTLPAELPLRKSDGALVVLFKGALPLSLVTDIYFASETEKTRFLQEVKQIANISPDHYRFRVRKTLFGKSMKKTMDRIGKIDRQGETLRWTDYLRTEAVGGILAHLFKSGHPHPELTETIEGFFSDTTSNIMDRPDIPGYLRSLSVWLRSGKIPDPPDTESRILLSLLDLLSTKAHKSDPPARGIVKILRRSVEESDEKTARRLLELTDQIERLAVIGDVPAADFLEQSRSSVLNGLFLFLLKKNSRGLFGPQDNPALKDNDLVVAGILCGAWEGWTEMSREFRGDAALENAVSHAMAASHNRRNKTELNLGHPPPLPAPPAPLHYLLAQADWNNTSVSKAAFELIRTMKWDCVKTIVRIPQGEYTLIVGSGKPARLVMDGYIEPKYEIDRDEFLDRLKNQKNDIPEKTAAAVRRRLEK